MLNFKIVVENKNLFFLKAIQKKLEAKSLTCEMAEGASKKENCILTIKIKTDFEVAAKLSIYEIFTDTLLTEYKLNFLTKNLTFSGLNLKLKKVLTKALCYFDRSIDEQIIYKELKDVKNVIYFESFLKFRLHGLDARWVELVKLVNTNSGYFLSSETFIDFLKFLVDSIDYIVLKLDISFTENYYMLSYRNKKEKVLRIEDNINLVLKVMSLSPEKIYLHVNQHASGEEINLLTNLFEERIEFIKEK